MTVTALYVIYMYLIWQQQLRTQIRLNNTDDYIHEIVKDIRQYWGSGYI